MQEIAPAASPLRKPTSTIPPDNMMMTGQTSQVWEVVDVHQPALRHEDAVAGEVRIRRSGGSLFHEAEVGMQIASPNIIKIVPS